MVSRVAALLRDAGERWVSRTRMHEGLGRNVTAQTLTATLGQLEEEGFAERRQVATEGRPREEWRLHTNEQTKKGPAGPDEAGMGDPLFVSSFVRDEEAVTTCCVCGGALESGRRYQCLACAEDGRRRNAVRFGEVAS